MLVEIDIPGNTFVVESKKESLQILAELDAEGLKKLAELSKYEKAIAILKKPLSPLVKAALGIKK